MSNENVAMECEHCGADVQDELKAHKSGEQLCESCYDDYRECDGCLNHYHMDDMTFAERDELFYCEDCSSDLDYCEHCEHYGCDLELSKVNDDHGNEIQCCSQCRDDMNTFYCERCNEYYSEDYYERYHIRGIGTVCQGCEEDTDTFTCVYCDETYETRNQGNDDEDEPCCRNCVEEHDTSYIHNYSFKPRPIFFKGKNEDNNALFFGLELEVEQKRSSVDRGTMAKKIQRDCCYFKSDGSLEYGFEIVTHPMTISYINENKETVFKSMLDELINNKYKSYDSNTCGMHIHLSKKAFGTWQLYRFIKFFIDNKDFITAISQRKQEHLERWAAIESEPDSSIIYKAKKKNGNSKRYVAINLQNDKTIELRVFRGTLNYYSFMKNIEFAYALFNFSRDVNDTSVEAFKKYISKSNEYTMLNKFIQTKNL